MQTRCHLSQLLSLQAEKYGSREAFYHNNFGTTAWQTVTWTQAQRQADRVARALLHLHIAQQEMIGIFSQNAMEYVYTLHGAWKVRVVVVPLYANSSEEQVRFITNEAHIRVLFVGQQEQYDKVISLLPVCPWVEQIVLYDKSIRRVPADKISIPFSEFLRLGLNGNDHELSQRLDSANGSDLMAILYTSGTTGSIKGVLLTHHQAQVALRDNDPALPLSEQDTILNFLPFAHIFELAWSMLAITKGAKAVILSNPGDVLDTMRQWHPTAMCAVPRFWEKVHIAVMNEIDGLPRGLQTLFRHAITVGKRHNIDYLSHGQRPPLTLEMEYKFVDKLVLSRVRRELGLVNPNFFPTAGAFVSPEIEEFIHSIGLFMMVGYGLTESFATVSNVHVDKPFTIGSIGRVLQGLSVRIGDDGEILIKGDTVTQGYFHRPELNGKLFTPDGYLKTGDAGYLKDGELYITERIKDLFKTSNGKYIAPQMIETRLLVDKFIDMIAVIADDRKFVSALIVPAYTLLETWAEDNNIAVSSRQELCNNPQVIAMMQTRIDILQQSLAPYETVKRITLLPEPFSIDRQEMTSTLKIRRNIVQQHYKELIDKMYQ